MRDLTKKKGRDPELRRTLCASLRNRNAHGRLTRAILRKNLKEKSRAPKLNELRPTFCASLCSRNARGHLAIFCKTLQEKCCAPEPRPTFCASLCSWNAHGHLTRAIVCENLQEKGRRSESVPWSTVTPASTLTVRTPQSGHTVFGKKHEKTWWGKFEAACSSLHFRESNSLMASQLYPPGTAAPCYTPNPPQLFSSSVAAFCKIWTVLQLQLVYGNGLQSVLQAMSLMYKMRPWWPQPMNNSPMLNN